MWILKFEQDQKQQKMKLLLVFTLCCLMFGAYAAMTYDDRILQLRAAMADFTPEEQKELQTQILALMHGTPAATQMTDQVMALIQAIIAARTKK